jgi:hypothetical protein
LKYTLCIKEVEKKTMLVKVVDNPHLVRDTETNAVLNKDMDGLQAYKLRKKQSSKVRPL